MKQIKIEKREKPPDCEFCRNLQIRENIKNFQNERNIIRGEQTILQEYTVALVVRSWEKGTSKRKVGRTTDYRYRGLGYKLNFCPECGKRVNWNG